VQTFFQYLLYIVLALTSLFLICLVLIQRGKGGGLAGAFGGAGGSSAFGTKAGDVFTRVTMIAAGVWIALNMLLVVVANRPMSAWGPAPSSSSKSEKSEVVPPKPEPAKSGEKVEEKTGTPVPKESTKTGEPVAPVSGGSPVSGTSSTAPPALPDAPPPVLPK
jgi:preprotein translocase subunit SecG